MKRIVPCSFCDGSDPYECLLCGGTGRITFDDDVAREHLAMAAAITGFRSHRFPVPVQHGDACAACGCITDDPASSELCPSLLKVDIRSGEDVGDDFVDK